MEHASEEKVLRLRECYPTTPHRFFVYILARISPEDEGKIVAAQFINTLEELLEFSDTHEYEYAEVNNVLLQVLEGRIF